MEVNSMEDKKLNEQELAEVTGGKTTVGDTPHKYNEGQTFQKYEDYCNYTFTVRDIYMLDGVLTYIGPLEQTSSPYKFTNVINSQKFTEPELEAFFHIV